MRARLRSMTIGAVLTAVCLSGAPTAGAVPASVPPTPEPLQLAERESAPEQPADGAAAAMADSAVPVGSVDLAREGFPNSPTITRIDGVDRYEAAANISASHFEPGVPVAYVASGKVFPDALAAGPVAGLRGAPILLTNTTSLPAATKAELERLKPGRIVVLGGRNTVDPSVQTALAAYTGGGVSRIGGVDRYEAAANISKSYFKRLIDVAYVATGSNYPDALAGGPVAALNGGPVLLVRRDSIPAATEQELIRLQPSRIVILGGPNSVSDAVKRMLGADVRHSDSSQVTRIDGADRWEAAANISASHFEPGVPVAYVASGKVFPDALAAGPVAGLRDAPILLTNTGTLPAATKAELERLQPERVVVLGGFNTVNWWVQTELSPYVTARPVAEYLPLPEGAEFGHSNALYGAHAVSCPAEGACVAVGAHRTGDRSVPVTFVQEGTSWTAVVPPVPDDALDSQWSGTLTDVSCEAVGECVAVGHYNVVAGRVTPLVLTMSEGSWGVTSVPLPDSSSGYQMAWAQVSCAPGACAVIGVEGSSTAGPGYGLLAHREDGVWTAQGTGMDGERLLAVRCRADAPCIATGERDETLLVARWAGSSWSVDTVTEPSWARSTGRDVDCISADSCVVVGGYQAFEGGSLSHVQGFTATWDGSTWTAEDVATPPWAEPGLNTDDTPVTAVDCLDTECAAVGIYEPARYELYPMVTVGLGTQWWLSEMPWSFDYASSMGAQEMTSLWCSEVGQCLATAEMQMGSSDPRRVVFVDDFPWWQPFVVDAPDGSSLAGPYQTLGGSDCAGEPGICVGVGADSQGRPVVIR